MKLSAEHFAELTASFNATQTGSNHEKRRAARLDLQAKIKIHPIAGDRKLDAIEVMCSNFSTRGLSFIHNIKMENGRQFVTEMPRKTGGSLEMLCTVMHSTSMGVNAFRIGAEFTCVIPKAPPPQPADALDEVARIRKSMMG
ncbi:MAG TPA: PilZ domain-containing protein [Tepidisphaeraceae bacterium]|nr:PilZ domain-containing protein [Tepidisphaeraceae bacterium]